MQTKIKGNGLSNIELAANSAWITASTRPKCLFCGYVSSHVRLAVQSARCPRCKQRGKAWEAFPSGACIRRLEIVAELYVKAYAAANEKRAALAEDIRQVLGRTPEASWIGSAILEVRKLRRRSRSADTEYARFLARLQERLAIENADDGGRIFYLLATYSDISAEHSDVVTSTASLFEQLFREFLVELLVARGVTYREARSEISKLRLWRRLEGRFEKVTGVKLGKAVAAFGVKELYGNWRTIAERRNDYSHRNPWAISARATEAAFGAAKNAFALFSFLHNSYCLLPVPPSGGTAQSSPREPRAPGSTKAAQAFQRSGR